jgi:hypothetical protein
MIDVNLTQTATIAYIRPCHTKIMGSGVMCKAVVIFIIISVKFEIKVKISRSSSLHHRGSFKGQKSGSCCPRRQGHMTELAFLFAFYFLLFHCLFFSTLILLFSLLRFFLILLLCVLPLYFCYYEVCLERSRTNYTKHSTPGTIH